MSKLFGVIVILTRDCGMVAAVGTDFDKSSPGGLSLKDSQRRRAEQDCAHNFLKSYIGLDELVSVIKAADYAQGVNYMRELCTKHKWRLTYECVGHKDD